MPAPPPLSQCLRSIHPQVSGFWAVGRWFGTNILWCDCCGRPQRCGADSPVSGLSVFTMVNHGLCASSLFHFPLQPFFKKRMSQPLVGCYEGRGDFNPPPPPAGVGFWSSCAVAHPRRWTNKGKLSGSAWPGPKNQSPGALSSGVNPRGLSPGVDKKNVPYLQEKHKHKNTFKFFFFSSQFLEFCSGRSLNCKSIF